MKQFFIKKECFAAFFLVFILGFSVINMIVNREMISELKEEFCEIEGIAELKEWISTVETETTEEILGRMEFVETYGFLQKLMDKQEFNSFAFIQDDDDMLYYGSMMELSTDDLDEYAQNVMRLNEYVESKGAKLLVVIPPSKVLAGVSTVNTAWPLNNPNNRTDKLMILLQQYGVNAVDLRSAMIESGASLEELFFKTDHHWTPLAAFYGTTEVVKQIKERFGEDLDPNHYYTNLDNYHTYTFEQTFLGSTGRNTGAVYSGLDDYTLMWPECNMEFTWINEEDDDEKTGSMTEALLNPSVVMNIEDIYDSNTNRIYMEEVVDKDKIINNSRPDLPKLTVLRDSYFTPMAFFLAPMCSEIDMLWTRNSDGINLEEFVKDSDADYVILEVYPYNLDETSFDFFHAAEE